jgi:hypothetical protein
MGGNFELKGDKTGVQRVTEFVAANVKLYVCLIFVSMLTLSASSAMHAELCAFRWGNVANWIVSSGSPTCRWLSYSNYVLHTVVDSSFIRIFLK